MIAATYMLSGLLLAGSGALFDAGLLSATTQTLAWTVVFFFASAAASAAYLTIGESFPLELRALAIASPERNPQAKNIPTLREQGVSNADADSWAAFFAPAKTPQPVLDVLSKAIIASLNKPATRDAIIKLGASLGLSTTAEGIETDASLDWLSDQGCHFGQGYLFGHAMPKAEMDDVLAAARSPAPFPDLARAS